MFTNLKPIDLPNSMSSSNINKNTIFELDDSDDENSVIEISSNDEEEDLIAKKSSTTVATAANSANIANNTSNTNNNTGVKQKVPRRRRLEKNNNGTSEKKDGSKIEKNKKQFVKSLVGIATTSEVPPFLGNSNNNCAVLAPTLTEMATATGRKDLRRQIIRGRSIGRLRKSTGSSETSSSTSTPTVPWRSASVTTPKVAELTDRVNEREENELKSVTQPQPHSSSSSSRAPSRNRGRGRPRKEQTSGNLLERWATSNVNDTTTPPASEKKSLSPGPVFGSGGSPPVTQRVRGRPRKKVKHDATGVLGNLKPVDTETAALKPSPKSPASTPKKSTSKAPTPKASTPKASTPKGSTTTTSTSTNAVTSSTKKKQDRNIEKYFINNNRTSSSSSSSASKKRSSSLPPTVVIYPKPNSCSISSTSSEEHIFKTHKKDKKKLQETTPTKEQSKEKVRSSLENIYRSNDKSSEDDNNFYKTPKNVKKKSLTKVDSKKKSRSKSPKSKPIKKTPKTNKEKPPKKAKRKIADKYSSSTTLTEDEKIDKKKKKRVEKSASKINPSYSPASSSKKVPSTLNNRNDTQSTESDDDNVALSSLKHTNKGIPKITQSPDAKESRMGVQKEACPPSHITTLTGNVTQSPSSNESHMGAQKAGLEPCTHSSLPSKELYQIFKVAKAALMGTNLELKQKGEMALSIVMNSLGVGDTQENDKNDVLSLLSFAKTCPLVDNDSPPSTNSSKMDTFSFGGHTVNYSPSTPNPTEDQSVFNALSSDIRACLQKERIEKPSDILLYPSMNLSKLMQKSNLLFPLDNCAENQSAFENVVSFKNQISHFTATVASAASANPNLKVASGTFGKPQGIEKSTSPIERRMNDNTIFSLENNECLMENISLSSLLSHAEVSILKELRITTVKQLFDVDVTNLVSDVFYKWKQKERTWEFCYGIVYSWFLRAKEACIQPDSGSTIISQPLTPRPSRPFRRKLPEKELTFQPPPPPPPLPSLNNFLSSSETSFLNSMQVHDVFQLLNTELDDLVTCLEKHWSGSTGPCQNFCKGVVNSWLVRAKEAREKYEHTKTSCNSTDGRGMLSSCLDKYMLQFLEEVDIFTANDFLMADVDLLVMVYRKWLDFNHLSYIVRRDRDISKEIEALKEKVKKWCTWYTDICLQDDTGSDKESDGTFVTDVEETAYLSSTSLSKKPIVAKRGVARKSRRCSSAFSLKMCQPIPLEDDIPIMECIDISCQTMLDETTNLPYRNITVLSPCSEYIFDFVVSIQKSNIPNSGWGAYLTYEGARKAKDKSKLTYYSDSTNEWDELELHALRPHGGGTVVTIKAKENLFEDEPCTTVQGPFPFHDYKPCSVNFCSNFQGCGLIDIGRYAPFLPTDRKPKWLFAVKDFIFSHEPSGWVFDVVEQLNKKDQVVDLTDDATGEPHDVAKSNIAMYVNEVGHDPSLTQNVLIKDMDDRIVKYYYVQKDALKTGQTVELLVNYERGYEEMRERKGYGKRNLSDEVKSDSHDASRYQRNFKERQEMKEFAKTCSEEDLLIILNFLKERVMLPLYKVLNRTGDTDGIHASWRQWVARRRLHWLGGILSAQFEHVISRSGSHCYTEGNSSASESNSEDPDSAYIKTSNEHFPVGSFVYVNDWKKYDNIGQVKSVRKKKDGKIDGKIFTGNLYTISREKQMFLYDVPEGVLSFPTEEEMASTPERWRREKEGQQLAEKRREMRAILNEMSWNESLNRYIPAKFDHNNNAGDFDLYCMMHRELSEEIMLSVSKKNILNPYNESFWCPTSIQLFRTLLHHMTSFELSPCPKAELASNIFIAATVAASNVRDYQSRHTNSLDNDLLSFQQKPLSKKYFSEQTSEEQANAEQANEEQVNLEQANNEQVSDEQASDKQTSNEQISGSYSCIVPFFDSTPTTSQQFSQLKSTEADLQAYYDVLELCNMKDDSCYVSLSDLIIKDKKEVSIVMTKVPWKNTIEGESGISWDMIPRNINLVKSGHAEVHRYWYLWHQILSVVHPLVSQIDWTQESTDDDDDDGDNDIYSLEKLSHELGMDLNDIELMNVMIPN